jgi:hypothetical protein
METRWSILAAVGGMLWGVYFGLVFVFIFVFPLFTADFS